MKPPPEPRVWPLPAADERFAALALWCLQGQSRRRIASAVERAGSFAAALERHPDAARLGAQALSAAEALGVRVLVPGEADWPLGFEALAAPPGALFVLGAWPAMVGRAVAIVGSRHPTAAGLGFAEALAREVSAQGSLVVSGGALGIDAAAHRGALGHGPTVAVLAGGLDRRYPPQNADLFEALLADGGALITEIPFGVPALASLFPRRNRLIAALAQVTVVVQAARRSGSLITAREAKALGKTVLSVPGSPGDAVAEGSNDLLRRGARICTGLTDVLVALGGESGASVDENADPTLGVVPPASTGSADLDGLAELLSVSPRSFDEISRKSGMLPPQLAAALTRLELLGLARRAPGGHFYRPVPAAAPENRP